MRRALSVLAGVTALLVGFAGQASAESATVSGTGDITKLVAKNGASTAVAKVFGLSKPCEAQYLHLTISSKRAGQYRAEGSCIQGSWYKGLYYHASADDQNPKKVTCGGFKFTYNADHHFYKVVMPRSCLSHAPNRIRMSAEGMDYGSGSGGSAGPTKLLDRG